MDDKTLSQLTRNVKSATTRETLDRICDRVHAEGGVKHLCGTTAGLRLMRAVEERKAYFAGRTR